jgi:uncharacterized RDD family membrane protein YckC/pSer/pThr/pTyr-binding forkhead associated (FHA) protein
VLLTVKPGELWARDLQSSNGTYLNGERMTTERLLHDGDRITIGETEIVARVTAPVMEEVGATVQLDTAKLECAACGAELPLHAEFCGVCGHRVGTAVAAAAGDMDAPPAIFTPAPPPPPASAPALPPTPYVPPPLVAPPGPPPRPLPGTPPVPAAREEAPPPAPAPSPFARERLATSGAEILPPIADHVFEPPAPPPLRGRSADAGARRPALDPTPPPLSLADVQMAQQPAAPSAAATAPVMAAIPAATLRPAGFWIRVAANVVDAVWISVVLFAATLPFGGPTSSTGSMVLSLLSVLLGIVVPILCWAIFGATPGKALLGLRVIGGKRRRGLGIPLAFLRLCGMMVSAVLLGLGFLMVAFTRDKRGLHDHLAGTAVIRR